ncbi:MAG: DNA primase [Bacillota bacterium]
MADYVSEVMIDEIRSANDIVDFVSEYVQLEKRGKDYFGLCPFHREKTPSFSVIPNKQIYYCFGCNKGGNVLHFIMEIEKLDFKEALKTLADRAKITLPDMNSATNEKEIMLKKEIAELNREAARFFYNTFLSDEGSGAREYLAKREITTKTSRHFGIGYAPNEWDGLYKAALERGFSKEAISSSGLFSLNKNGGFFDKFRNRLMFPIFNITGSVIAFGGRLIDDSDGPKYMNSPETPVYSKGRHLYALNFAKAVQSKQLFVVEGYMDVIAMHQSGFSNTVASLGTALTENQARLLKKYAEEIVICYDSDAAGQAATLRGLDILKNVGCTVKVLTITDAKDPDEFIRKNGNAAFKKLASKADSLVEYKVSKLKEKYTEDTVDGRKALILEIAQVLLQVDVSVEREMYIEKFAKENNISESALQELVDTKLGRTPSTGLGKKTGGLRSESSGKLSESRTYSKCVYDERMLIAFLCMDNNLLKVVEKKISKDDFTGEENKMLAEIVFSALEQGKPMLFSNLLDRLEGPMASQFAALIQKDCATDNVRDALNSKLTEIVHDHLDLEIEMARAEVRESDDPIRVGELLKLIAEKTALRKQINN